MKVAHGFLDARPSDLACVKNESDVVESSSFPE